jgi:hypothetical protein
MTAAAPVVRLWYFPYSTVGKRAPERVLCAICLEVFEHGEACGEVPACGHFFHRACVDVWRKSSVSCPLCKGYMAGSSGRAVSVADDMV